jgi:hypothetical protein
MVCYSSPLVPYQSQGESEMHLNRFQTLLIVVSLLALGVNVPAKTPPPRPQGQARDTSAIEKAFLQYRDALLEGNGSKAAELVGGRTITLYDEIVTHALKMPRQNLAQLDFISKFMVLRIRYEFNKSQIEKMTGRELFIIGVEKGWISKSSVSNVKQLAKIKVDLYEASASIPQAPDVPVFHFLNESGQWKLNLLPLFEMFNVAMKQEVTKSGLTEEQFIMRALNTLSSKKVDERILSGPLE